MSASDTPRSRIVDSCDDASIAAARDLFTEYARSLGIDLAFQGFDAEMASFPDRYLEKHGGALRLASVDGQAAGCVGLRRFDTDIGEMKRLYVRPTFRGYGLGRRLAIEIIEDARRLRYRRLRLDTLADMGEARALYETLGFQAIPAYYDNPIPGTTYLELEL